MSQRWSHAGIEQGGGILLKGAFLTRTVCPSLFLKVDRDQIAWCSTSCFTICAAIYSTRQDSATKGTAAGEAKTDHAAMILLRVG